MYIIILNAITVSKNSILNERRSSWLAEVWTSILQECGRISIGSARGESTISSVKNTVHKKWIPFFGGSFFFSSQTTTQHVISDNIKTYSIYSINISVSVRLGLYVCKP